jgi:serine/threonine protein kinase
MVSIRISPLVTSPRISTNPIQSLDSLTYLSTPYCPCQNNTLLYHHTTTYSTEPVGQVRNEIAVLKRVSAGHPNICRLVDHFETAHNLYLVFDLCTGGELFDRICSKGNYYERYVPDKTRFSTKNRRLTESMLCNPCTRHGWARLAATQQRSSGPSPAPSSTSTTKGSYIGTSSPRTCCSGARPTMPSSA